MLRRGQGRVLLPSCEGACTREKPRSFAGVLYVRTSFLPVKRTGTLEPHLHRRREGLKFAVDVRGVRFQPDPLLVSRSVSYLLLGVSPLGENDGEAPVERSGSLH